MNHLPKSLNDVIDAMLTLPGVGPRGAERYAYFILKKGPVFSKNIASSLVKLHQGIGYCPITFALIESDQKVSPLYSNPDRDKTVVAVVADPMDILAIEKTGQYKGTYHVLGGLVSPIDGITPDDLNLKQLKKRIKEDKVKEVILAINASVEGDATIHVLQSFMSDTNVSISKLARGLPIGLDLEHADQVTLGRALEGRQQLI